MNVKIMVDMLRQVPIFSGIDPAQLQLLIFSAANQRLETGQILARKNDKPDCAYLILSGQAEALGEDETRILADVRSGALVGELSMIAKQPYCVTVRAKTALNVAQIKHDLFMRVCTEFPDTSMHMLRVLTSRLDSTLGDLQGVQKLIDQTRPLTRA